VNTPVSPPVRLTSLYAFCGLTMAAMVIVKCPSDGDHAYAPLVHAPRHEWTPTDLIFPYFLFIVGVSMTLSRGTLGDPYQASLLFAFAHLAVLWVALYVMYRRGWFVKA
jgi:predicted acyltransferase